MSFSSPFQCLLRIFVDLQRSCTISNGCIGFLQFDETLGAFSVENSRLRIIFDRLGEERNGFFERAFGQFRLSFASFGIGLFQHRISHLEWTETNRWTNERTMFQRRTSTLGSPMETGASWSPSMTPAVSSSIRIREKKSIVDVSSEENLWVLPNSLSGSLSSFFGSSWCFADVGSSSCFADVDSSWWCWVLWEWAWSSFAPAGSSALTAGICAPNLKWFRTSVKFVLLPCFCITHLANHCRKNSSSGACRSSGCASHNETNCRKRRKCSCGIAEGIVRVLIDLKKKAEESRHFLISWFYSVALLSIREDSRRRWNLCQTKQRSTEIKTLVFRSTCLRVGENKPLDWRQTYFRWMKSIASHTDTDQ